MPVRLHRNGGSHDPGARCVGGPGIAGAGGLALALALGAATPRLGWASDATGGAAVPGASAANTHVASAQAASVNALIQQIVEDAHHPDIRWPDFPYYEDEMRGLYQASGWAPFWFREGAPVPQVDDVIAVLESSPERGLDPADYDATALAATRAALRSGTHLDARALALFDTGLSIGYLRQISDTHIGRITPSRVGVRIDVDAKKYDLVARVRQAVAANRIRAAVDEAKPQFAVYRRLEKALADYRRLAASPLPAVQLPGTVRPGDALPQADALATRLRAFGDLPADASVPPGRYDGALVDAVKRFQERHGLAADGVVGPATARALDVPPARRVRQIELGLERLRWVPDLAGRRAIVVNLPAFHLWAFDAEPAGGTPALEMRVVIGKAMKTDTPVFEEEMEYVVFYPYWNVPQSIVRGELVPALRRDPQALEKRNMELVRGSEDRAALPVTSENIALLSAGKLRVRQRPGPRNALGPAKFMFPNDDAIYMHGTPSQALFERARRDFSHGCIRLENPPALAEFVLAGQPEWTRERIDAAMNGPSPRRVNLPEHIPVLLFYTTALVGQDGRVWFYDDLYGHDARLERELETAYPMQP